GIDIDRNEVYKTYSITRKNIGQIVVDYSGFSPDFVRDNITSRESKCYIPSNKMSLSEGVNLIREAGGLAVLAHPCLIKKSDPLEILKAGFDGIEAVYPSVKNDEKRFRIIAKEKGLLVTGGSDFHTLNDNTADHGVIGTSTIEDGELELFLERLYG
ncbi:MAG: hypothetical protein J5850_00830, partial [Clostridia bacterium]|nr:hypothetical protein [Clostridia bacterium]